MFPSPHPYLLSCSPFLFFVATMDSDNELKGWSLSPSPTFQKFGAHTRKGIDFSMLSHVWNTLYATLCETIKKCVVRDECCTVRVRAFQRSQVAFSLWINQKRASI